MRNHQKKQVSYNIAIIEFHLRSSIYQTQSVSVFAYEITKRKRGITSAHEGIQFTEEGDVR